MLTALDYATRAQKRIRDEAYPATDMYVHLSDTVNEVFNSRMLPEQEESYSANLVAGEHVFEFQSDHTSAQAVTIIDPTIENDGTDITNNYLPWETFNKLFPNPANQEPTRPFVYTIRNRQIWFSHPVDYPYILKVEYIKSSKQITQASDTVEVPDNYSEMLVMGMCERAEETKDNFAKADYYRSKFKELLEDYTIRSSVQNVGNPSTRSQFSPWSRTGNSGA
jgi:hypothetical protein